MNWDGRSAWVYRDSPPDYAKALRYRIDTVYIDPRTWNAPTVCADIRAHALTAGFYYVPGWTPGPTPQEHAKIVSDYVQVNKLLKPGEPVMLDLEQLSIPWVEAFLKKLRAYLPSRPLAYTNAPFQNETVVPVAALEAADAHWFPQLYYGQMQPADAAAVMAEVCRIYDPAKVHPFHDGAMLPVDSRDCCVFTLERLP